MANERILIVDDNPANMKLLDLTLSAKGYEIQSCRNAAETFKTLETFAPHLILMDLQMPGVDGYELTRRLKALRKMQGVPIVAVTAYAMSGDEQKAIDAGCDGYITKPISTLDLPNKVAEIIANLPGRKTESPHPG